MNKQEAVREDIEVELLHAIDEAYELGKRHDGIDLYEHTQELKRRLSTLGVCIQVAGELRLETFSKSARRRYGVQKV